MGTDDLHKKRTNRKIGKREEQKSVLIATEDEKSSRYYFEALIKDKKLNGKVVIAKHIGTNSKKVLNALLEHLEKNPKSIYEKKWIVIDKDDYSLDEYKGAIEEARQKDICVAFSNECYELWILLHFREVNAWMSRDDLDSELKTIFRAKYRKEYSKSSRDVYGLIIGQQQIAIENAKKLVTQNIGDNGKINSEKNPLTTIYQLVECLNGLSESQSQCDCYPCQP